MSGIVGIVHLDGSPIDDSQLRHLTKSLGAAGPDGQQAKLLGPVGLGHALLKTQSLPELDEQPFSLDQNTWVTADVRLDGRFDLLRSLQAMGLDVSPNAPDARLILHAYSVWGDDCVNHLLGDFAFVIWEKDKQRLFCARDHLGIKPFFYARRASVLVLSNNLNTVLQHPLVRDHLDERTVGDQLTFGGNIRGEATFFSDVRSLPHGHSLALFGTEPRLRRYWTLSDFQPIRYRRGEEYVEHFRELFDTAVADRIGTDRVGALMSGGLDSTSVAVTAQRHLKERGGRELQAWTWDCSRIIENDEASLADLVSRTAGISQHYLRENDYPLYARYQPPDQIPVSVEGPLAASSPLPLQRLSADCRVALMGHNAEVLGFYPDHILHLLKTLRMGHLLGDLREHYRMHRTLPRLGLLRSTVKSTLWRWGWRRSFPSWVTRGFAERMELVDRWEHEWAQACSPSNRIETYLRSRSSGFSHLLEALDPGQTFARVEVRHPLADLRLVRFVLSIPAIPWCLNKQILREAMRGRLPEEVRCRPKTNIPARPRLRLQLDRDRERWKHYLRSAPGLGEYVSIPRAEEAIERFEARNFQEAYVVIAPLSLAVWLKRLRN